MQAFNSIFKTEFKLSIRDLNIPIFGIAFPVIVAVVIGLVAGNNPVSGSSTFGFIDQSFGGFITIAVCATGLMGLPLQLADYREKKVLKQYMVTPVSPARLLIVQCLVNFIMSLISLVLLFGISTAFWGFEMRGSWGLFLASYLLVTAAIYSLGMVIASLAPDIKTSNLLCMLFYFPMLLFSGATVPYEIMPQSAQRIMDFLPLTQGIKLLKSTSLGIEIDRPWLPVLILLVIAIAGTALSIRTFKWE